jgi:glutamine synthetase
VTIGVDARTVDAAARAGAGIGQPDEVATFLAANPDIEAVQLVLTDANGVGRGKNVAREEVPARYAHGRNVA